MISNWFGNMRRSFQQPSPTEGHSGPSSGNQGSSNLRRHYSDAHANQNSWRQQRGRNDDEIEQRHIQDLLKQCETHKPDQVMQEVNRIFAVQDELIKSLHLQNKTLYDQNKTLYDQNESLRVDKRRLERRIDQLGGFSQSHHGMTYRPPVTENTQPWRSVSCHLLEDPSSHCHSAVDAFVNKVSGHFQSQRINLMVNRLSSITSEFVSNGQPIVVPCLNSCRLGTDVKTAYKKYNIGGQKVILLVFHHQASHSKFGAGSQVLLDADLHRNATLILDVLYQTTEGVYDCSQNTDAITSLASQIQTQQNS